METAETGKQEVGRQIADLEESLRFQKVIKLEQGPPYWVLNGATEHKAFFFARQTFCSALSSGTTAKSLESWDARFFRESMRAVAASAIDAERSTKCRPVLVKLARKPKKDREKSKSTNPSVSIRPADGHMHNHFSTAQRLSPSLKPNPPTSWPTRLSWNNWLGLWPWAPPRPNLETLEWVVSSRLPTR